MTAKAGVSEKNEAQQYRINHTQLMNHTLRFESIARPLKILDIRSPYESDLVMAHYAFGAYVEKGSALFELQSIELENNIFQQQEILSRLQDERHRLENWPNEPEYIKAKLNLAQAKMQYKQAKMHFNHSQSLYQKGIISQQSCQQDHNQLLQAKKNYIDQKQIFKQTSLQANPQKIEHIQQKWRQSNQYLTSLQRTKSKLAVLSPLKGVLLPDVEEGKKNNIVLSYKDHYVQDEVIARIAELTPFAVIIHVTENEMLALRQNPKIRVQLTAMPGLNLTTKILEVRHNMNHAEDYKKLPKFDVVLSVEAIDPFTQPFLFGMKAQVSIETNLATQGVMVPKQFVYFDQDIPYCWVQQPRNNEKRLIQLGQRNAQWVEVLSGLQEGESVVAIS